MTRAEPITSPVQRGFQNPGVFCKRFLPSSPPPPSLISCSRPIFRAANCSRPIFRAAKSSKSRSSDFFCSETPRKCLLRSLLISWPQLFKSWIALSNFSTTGAWCVQLLKISRDGEVSNLGFELVMQISWLHIQCAAS